MTDRFEQEFEQYKQERAERELRAAFDAEVAEAAAQLTEAEREQAARMGMSALAYLRGKEGGGPLTADAPALAQLEQADKMGVVLDPTFDRPVAWWNSAGATEEAFAQAHKRGPAVAAALSRAYEANQARVRRGLPADVPIPKEAL